MHSHLVGCPRSDSSELGFALCSTTRPRWPRLWVVDALTSTTPPRVSLSLSPWCRSVVYVRVQKRRMHAEGRPCCWEPLQEANVSRLSSG
jgi:hypothetical protein